MSGEVDKVKAILEAAPEKVNARGPKNRTPLHCAAKGDTTAVARYLISVGADTEARTAYKMTPLHVAAFYGSSAVMRLLLEEVQDLDIDALDFGSWTSLHYACNYDWGDCASLLIDHGASLTKRSAELQLVALHLAARSGNLPTVKKLVSKGCNASQRNLFYTTPLHLACQNDHMDVVRFLLKSGASPDAPDEAGITPAQLTKRDDICRALEEEVNARQRAPPPPPPAA
eukprot:g2724.t1